MALFQKDDAKRIKASNISKWLLSHGVSSITTDEIATLIGVQKNHVPQRMVSLRRKNEIISPARGLWLPIPPEYMSWGAPPAIDIIDPLMKHLNADYYVGWLSAAEFYGASHHAPQVFQVATSRTLRQKIIGRSRLQFFHREHLSNVPLIHIESKNAMIPISSRETTLLDIANDIAFVGGIDNATNIIIELCDDTFPDIDALINTSRFYPAAAVRRLGFLIETFTDTSNLDKLVEICIERNTATSVLDPIENFVGKTDKRWNIKINREVMPDV